MEQPIQKDLTGLIVNKNYKLLKRLGSGAFGEIYQAVNSQGQPKDVAVKIEMADAKHPQIFFEAKLYTYLNNHAEKCGEKGIPKFYNSLTEGGYNFLIMELLGQSLEDIFTNNNRRFSLRTATLLGLQMLDAIEFLHSKQFLHRDIKPDNFLMGTGTNKHKVYMVDFGLAKRYISKEGHIAYKENKSLTGTARYASINTHLGIEQSRRDDLESLGYVLMYFLRGNLPWQNLRANNQREKYERILEKKLATSTEALCKGYPKEFVTIIEYSKNLKFDEKPDYGMIKGQFKQIMENEEFEYKYVYDWDEDEQNQPTFQINDVQKPLMIRQPSQPTSQENIPVVNEKLPTIRRLQQKKSQPNTTATILISQLQRQQRKQQPVQNVYNNFIANTLSVNSIINPQLIKKNSIQQQSVESRQNRSSNQLYNTIYQKRPLVRQLRHNSQVIRRPIHSTSLPHNSLYQ